MFSRKIIYNEAILFGSYAQNTATDKSDIDLLLDSALKGFGFVGLTEEIRAALDKYADVFDVSNIEYGSRIFNEIRKDGILIYEE